MGRRRRKTGRRKQHYKTSVNANKNVTQDPLAASTGLPLGACKYLNDVTSIWLVVGDKQLLIEWKKVCLRLVKFISNERIFYCLESCIGYIKYKKLTELNLQVYKANAAEMIKIRETINQACNQNPLIHFQIFNVIQIRFGRAGMCIKFATDDDNDQGQSVDSEMPVPIAIYGLVHDEQKSVRDLTADEIRFMWYQLLVDVLLRMPRNTATMSDMLNVARAHYATDLIELRKIDTFEQTYEASKAIWWYTQDTFVYRLLNIAFRTQDIRIIFVFRFFILDLHTQLISASTNEIEIPSTTLFRGQILSLDELNMIKKNIGGLISMNTFFSTTIDCQVACVYAAAGSAPSGYASVLFEINLNNTKNVSPARPFASIGRYSSKNDENEVLFGMGSIFRIVSVEDYDSMCLVDLEIENQPTECISKLSSHLLSRYRRFMVDEGTFGDFLLEMGELQQANLFYKLMLEQLNPDIFEIELAHLQNSIGLWYIDQGDFKSSKVILEQALVLAQNHQVLTSTILNNLGLTCLNLGHYSHALKYFKRSKKLRRDKKHAAIIYENISSVYIEKGLYKKAKHFAQKALAIDEKYLPSVHSDLAATYMLLASIESDMENFKDALDLYEKALTIYRQSLPPGHRLFANVLNNIGSVYNSMRLYDRALEYYEEALGILLVTFQHNADDHLLVAQSLNNIATCQYAKNDFPAAEDAFKRALDTKLKVFGEESKLHPSLAIAYNNLAMIQLKQNHLDEALANFERTVAIEESVGNNAAISSTYNNIGKLYVKKGEFAEAERWQSKAYESALNTLPSNHSDLQLYARDMEHARMMMAQNSEQMN